MPTVSRRVAAGAGAITLTAGLVFGSGVAFADPVDPTAAAELCATLDARVAALPDLESAQDSAEQTLSDAVAERDRLLAALNGIGADDAGFEKAQQDVADARASVSEADEALAVATRAVTSAEIAVGTARQNITDAGVDCDNLDPTPEPTPEPTPTTEPEPEPTPTPTPVPVASFDELRDRINNLDCDDTYNADSGSISDELIARATEPGVFETIGLFADKQQALNYCVPEPTVTSIPLDPTDDDDSVANVSGSQVRDVPEGSASTGDGA